MIHHGVRVLEHLTGDLISGSLDDELGTEDEQRVRTHLSGCEDCTRRYQEIRLLSSRLQSLVYSTEVTAPAGERQALENWLEMREREARNRKPAPGVLARQVAAGMAMAAALALGVLLIPRTPHSERRAATSEAGRVQPLHTFEIANETFVALPYATSDLPFSTPEIVQMKLPVASLAEAGVVERLGPGAVDLSGEETVLADVLIGADGEPLGVHVLD